MLDVGAELRRLLVDLGVAAEVERRRWQRRMDRNRRAALIARDIASAVRGSSVVRSTRSPHDGQTNSALMSTTTKAAATSR
jgi:hypothetical protein